MVSSRRVFKLVRASFAVVVVALFAVAPLLMAVPAARAADVSVTLIAKNTSWNVGTETSGVTTISVNVGDTLRLRIENRDSFLHTFTANQFPAVTNQGGGGVFLNVTMTAGRIFFWNRTMTSADAGNWQFYCIPHSTGTYPNRSGMTGAISVATVSPPPTSIDPFVIGSVLLVVVIIVAVVAVAMRRRKKKA